MALLTKRPFSDMLLPLGDGKGEAHIFEPEFHQDVYRSAGERAQAGAHGAFQLGDSEYVSAAPNRGKQPDYVDDLDDPETLRFIGKLTHSGTRLTEVETDNVAALKSVSIRGGYVDLDSARAVSRAYYDKNKARTSVRRGDILINSTGDGTIGRVSVYHYDFPAVVDGHITIVRPREQNMGWYIAAYLLTDPGQHQLYRYINGSSGQVEIYPQDISRLWIPLADPAEMATIGNALATACQAFETFRAQMGNALALATAAS